MDKSKAIGRIISSQWPIILERCSSHQIRHLHAIRSCRTPAMGGHLYVCDHCAATHMRYNSCRNRHCPQCQNTQKLKWIEQRERQLLPCPYFHIVFTIPDALNQLNLIYPKQLYSLLFQCAWQTLDTFGWNPKYLGAQLGATMVLHTWGSNLSYHPHVHCIVPAAGITLKNKWKQAKGKGKFIFPVKALSTVFKGKYITELQKFMIANGMDLGTFKTQLHKADWVVYAKPPTNGKKGLINYLARYTHQIAITNHRIIKHDDHRVIFTFKDYRHTNKTKLAKITAWEFVRRLAQHILPHGFTRIRHYGILSSKWKLNLFPTPCSPTQDWVEFWVKRDLQIQKCPTCKKGRLIAVMEIPPLRGPPAHLLQHLYIQNQI